MILFSLEIASLSLDSGSTQTYSFGMILSGKSVNIVGILGFRGK